jgi:hypothetical protein
MIALSTGQIQSFAAKHTQRDDQCREVLLRQTKNRALSQRQLDPGTGLRRCDRQLQEIPGTGRCGRPEESMTKGTAQRDYGTSLSGTLPLCLRP